MRARARAESRYDVAGIDARWPGTPWTRMGPCFSTVPAYLTGVVVFYRSLTHALMASGWVAMFQRDGVFAVVSLD